MRIKADDIEINFKLSGNATGPVVAMSHSLGSSLIMWNPQMQALEENFHVLRFDTRGHGGTTATSGPYTMDLLVKDAMTLLDALELDQVHWVGLSMGGMIGQGLALEAPERLLSLSLCDTMAVIRDETKAMWRNRIQSGEQFGMGRLVDFAMERWFTESYRSSGGGEYEEIRSQFLATSVAGYVGCCHAIYNLNYLDQLKRIQLPTHIIVGDEDLATPVSESTALHERIAGSGMDIVSGAAHLSNIEQAEQFNESLLGFLNAR